MLILVTQSDPGNMTSWFIAVLLAWGFTSLILLAAPLLLRLLKERRLIALERLMGMILVMMAVQMLLNGYKALH